MYSIKLVTNTGIHWLDVVDLGVFSPDVRAVMNEAISDPKERNRGIYLLDYDLGGIAAEKISAAIDELNDHPDKYKAYGVDDILSAREYLSKLLAACKYHPGCEVRVETI